MNKHIGGVLIVCLVVCVQVQVLAQNKESIPEAVQRMDKELQDFKSGNWSPLGMTIEKGTLRIRAVRQDYGGNVVFNNYAGNEVGYVGCLANNRGGAGIFNNANGRRVAYIGATTGGDGVVEVNGRTLDYAEVFELSTRKGMKPGTIVSMAKDGSGIVPSTNAYDKRVVGVISGAGGLHPGMNIGSRKDESKDLPVAVAGQVYVRVCGESGAIEVGDLLVASSQSGVAMVGKDEKRLSGTVIGKALEPYAAPDDQPEGLIRMLVMVR